MTRVKEILGVKINFNTSLEDAVSAVDRNFLKDGRFHYICTTNPEFIVDAQTDPIFRDVINSADLSLPDGNGVLFADKYTEVLGHFGRLGKNPVVSFVVGVYVGVAGFIAPGFLHQNSVSGVQLTDKLLSLAQERGYSVFLLGGRYRDPKGVPLFNKGDLAIDAATEIRSRYPGINIVGATSKFSYKESDIQPTVDYIHSCMSARGLKKIDILLVAFNHPNQEKWIAQNGYNVPASVAVGVGGTFDYIVGAQKIEPSVFRSLRLGWLYRFITQPWRIKRIYKAFPKFPFLVYLNTLK